MNVHFEGSVSINAKRDVVYGMLTDPNFIAKNLPDAEEVHVIDDSHLEAKMKVRVAIVSSSLRVKLSILNKEPTTKATLIADGSGSGSNVKITSAFTLSGDESTMVAWTSDAEITGVIAGLGMTILKGYSTKKVTEIFGGITKSIEEQTGSRGGAGSGSP